MESLSTKAKDLEDKGRNINVEIEEIEKEVSHLSLRLNLAGKGERRQRPVTLVTAQLEEEGKVKNRKWKNK